MLRWNLRLVMPVALVCLAGWWFAGLLAAVPSTGTEQGLWQDGVWHIQHEVAKEVKEVLPQLKGKIGQLARATVAVRVAPECPWSFSSLRSEELAEYLKKRCSDSAAEVEFIPLGQGKAGSPADLAIELTVLQLVPNAADEPREKLHYVLAITRAGKTLRTIKDSAVCPAPYRNWFVRRRNVPVVWLVVTAAMGVVGAGILCHGAWQAFLQKYAGSARMWSGAALFLSGAGFLVATWIVAPLVRPVEIPLAQIGMVLEASDATLYGSPSAPAEANPQARFIDAFRKHLQTRLHDGGSQQGGQRSGEAADEFQEEKLTFWRWVHAFLNDLLAENTKSDTIRLKSARRLRPHRIDPERAGGSQLKPIGPEQWAETLRCGRLGRETCFVLPWEAIKEDATHDVERERLVVLFHTGNVGSLPQAYELERTLDQRCQAKPDTMRVLSVMMLDVERSEEPFESQELRAGRLCMVSDYFVSLDGASRPVGSAAGKCHVLSLPGLLDGSEAKKVSSGGPPGDDLDVERDRRFGHISPAKCEETAKRFAEYVAGLLVWDRVPVFCWNREVVWIMIAIAALLLLFLSLQDELTVLDTHDEPPRGHWLGQLLALVLGTLGCLYFVFCLREASAWTARGNCGFALGSLALGWYGTLWLPHYLGRGAGKLPPPAVGLHMRLPFWLLTAATLTILVALVAGIVVRVKTGLPLEFSLAGQRGYLGGSCLAGLSVALLLTLNAWFLRNRFARGHRRWIVRAGTAAGGLLLAWPWISPWLGRRQAFSVPLAVWVWLGVFALLYFLRWVFVDRTRRDRAAGSWDPGWRWLVFVLAAVPVAVGYVCSPFLAERLADGGPRSFAPAHDWVTCLATLLFAAAILLAAGLPGVLREVGWRRASHSVGRSE
jgi:hypothetical protein